jgi:hypothetical protein
MSIHPYTELINKEAEIIGVSDHLATELPALIEFVRAAENFDFRQRHCALSTSTPIK